MRETLAGTLYTQAEAAALLKVPPATLGRYKRRDDWPLPQAKCPPAKRRLGIVYTEEEIETIRTWMTRNKLPNRYTFNGGQ